MRPNGSISSFAVILLAVLVLFPCLGCFHQAQVAPGPEDPSPPPPAGVEEAAALPEPPSSKRRVENAISRSVEAYFTALEAYRAGDLDEARKWFDRSVEVLLDVSPQEQEDPLLEAAYQDLMANIHELLARWPNEAEDLTTEGEEIGTPVDELETVEPRPKPKKPPRAEKAPEPPRKKAVVYDIPIELNPRVQAFLDLYQGQWRDEFEAGFRRSGRYIDMIRRVFAEEGLPQDLAYIAHVESSFKSHALSRVRAYGLWQFMAATGRNYGLDINYWVDERADPEKATRAATRYLKFLHGMFGDWNLAMAAYNAGEYKVQRGIRATGYHDFWRLERTRYLRRETKNFVPAIHAAIVIYRSPKKYGFDPSDRVEPWEYDEVAVDGPVDLVVLAECAGTDLATLRSLNPELRRGTVPPEATSYRLRVPSGQGDVTLAKLAEVPQRERIRQVQHVVRRGETLSRLANRYGTSVRAIQSANRIRDPRRVRVGRRLTIPLTDGAYAGRWLSSTETDARTGLKVYTVRRGDNPYEIARRNRIPLDRLLRWNGLTRRSVIYPGERLYLESPGTTAPRLASRRSAPPRPTTTYVVRRGDTLSGIARSHRVSLGQLLAWNGLHHRSVIRPGDRLDLRPREPLAPVPGAGREVYVVRRGDTLYDIARAHGVALGNLLAWNGLYRWSVLHPGQVLVVSKEGASSGSSGGGSSPKTYVVRRGDTLYDISRAHSVTVADLCRWNGISSRKTLFPGERLTIYTR